MIPVKKTRRQRAAGDEIVSKKRNNGSIMWSLGLKKTDQQQLLQVICRECSKTVATKSGSTTNLFHHLQQRYKVHYKECVKLRGCAASPAATVSSAPKPGPALGKCVGGALW
ncbi:unnamed protein product [Boreogadus saida]